MNKVIAIWASIGCSAIDKEGKSKTYFKESDNVLWLVIGGKHPLVTSFGTGQNDALSAVLHTWNSSNNMSCTYLPDGLVVRIRRSHRRGPGSIPGQGTVL